MTGWSRWRWAFAGWLIVGGLGLLTAFGAEPAPVRSSLLLENRVAHLVFDLRGGSLGEFALQGNELNPLRWATPRPGNTGIQGFGHFLCLDRWGPASEAETARGMPYHGEAAHVEWSVTQPPVDRDGLAEAQMAARLPRAGLSVRRTLHLAGQSAACLVREDITNENALGRIFNVVQHPTIGPPFLDATTLVDCNGRRGFAQGGGLPNPEEPSSFWPQALNRNGESVNLRHLTSDPNPNVVSYVIEDAYGWVTATAPAQGLLIGYVWKVTDYPWVRLVAVRDGKPSARGLEFGTTGLHQPFPVLIRKGRIWDRPLVEYLDAGEMCTQRYLVFLCPVPADFRGVATIEVSPDRIRLRERSEGKARELTVEIGGLRWE